MLVLAQSAPSLPQESDYYKVDYLVPPPGAVIEVGGMDFTSDGRLVVSTRRGQVWIVDKPLADDPKEAGFHLFAEGLWEGLGLKVYKNDIFVLQRGELSRLSDVDGDGTCDRIDVVADGWGLSDNYHEFAYGLPVDEQGSFFFSLNVGFGDPKWWAGKSFAPYRGWVMEATRDGVVTPWACGFRSPCGISISPNNEMFVTDNQGDWEPVCPLYHVHKGKFYGHPASLKWTEEYLSTHTEPSDTVPPSREREAPCLWIPYKWVRSAGNCAWDQSLGEFGPFEDQMFIAELTNGMVVRASLEKVRGEYQGAVFLFRQKIGSVVRVAFATGGTMFCGMTNRGWGGLAPADGIARVRWTGKTPLEMRDVHVIDHGFQVVFTEPLSAKLALTTANVDLVQYHYDYYWEYGSPERDTTHVAVKDVALSADRKTLTFHAPALQAGSMARVVLSGIASASGEPLLHEEFDYTLNQFPDGPLCETPIARVVPPPAGRESKEEGWLRLCYGDALDQWKSSGWKLCDAELDAQDPRKFKTSDGWGALVNVGPDASDFTSKPVFGDAEVHASFILPEGSSGGLFLQGRYEIRFAPSERTGNTRRNLCASISGGANWKGFEPKIDAWKGAGQEHDLDVVFRAPRFDASGKKTKNALVERVSMDDALLYENVEIPEPSAGADVGEGASEVAFGPLRFHANGKSEIALGGIRVRPLDEAKNETGFVPLFDGDDLTGWSVRADGKATDASEWKVDDHVLASGGKTNDLVSARNDYRNFELDASLKLSPGGRSAIWFRAAPDATGMKGYAIVLNTSFPDKQHTGGLLDLAPIGPQLISDDTWFDLALRCRDEAEGTHIQVRLNGVLFTDFVDKERKFAAGAIALEQHHEGSVLAVKKLAIRELEK
jgi:glucose/arabinose dehydrogenase